MPKDAEGCRRIPKDTEGYRKIPKDTELCAHTRARALAFAFLALRAKLMRFCGGDECNDVMEALLASARSFSICACALYFLNMLQQNTYAAGLLRHSSQKRARVLGLEHS